MAKPKLTVVAKKPARNKKATRSVASKPDNVTAAPADKKGATFKAKMIGPNDLKNLMRQVEALKTQSQSTSGEAGKKVADAVESKHLDRDAFAIVKKLRQLKKSKGGQRLATTLACLDFYREVFKLDEEAAEQGELEIARQEAGEKENGVVNGKDKGTPENEPDLRPAHLRSVNEGGTRVDTTKQVEELKTKALGDGEAQTAH